MNGYNIMWFCASPVSHSAEAPWPDASSPEVTGIFGSRTSSPTRWSGHWRSGLDHPFVCVVVAGCMGTTAAASLQSKNKRTLKLFHVYTWQNNKTYNNTIDMLITLHDDEVQIYFLSVMSSLISCLSVEEGRDRKDCGQISASCASCSAVWLWAMTSNSSNSRPLSPLRERAHTFRLK